MIASRIVVVSEVVAELAFKMKLPRIHDEDVSALYRIFCDDYDDDDTIFASATYIICRLCSTVFRHSH